MTVLILVPDWGIVMYLQLTTRCNMSCEHCCFACNAQGDDMSRETFRAAIDLCEEWGSCITLGGGEPTLHPLFREFLMDAIAADIGDDIPPFIATNGSVKRHALLLAKLSKKQVVMAELSRDEWHDEIDYDVVDAFEGMVRDVSQGGRREPFAVGRALTVLKIEPKEYGNCACDDYHVSPDGSVRQCGCPDAPVIGNVNDGIDSEHRGCYKEIEEELCV